MKLFIFKPKKLSPLIFVITKLDSQESVEKLENMTSEIFQILVEQEEADYTNILVFSIIKDHLKSTINMILPAPKSDKKLIDKCHKNTQFLNALIVKTLESAFCEFYFEINENKNETTIYHEKLNLNSLISYYNTNNIV
jgi:hypothetical protein